MRNIIRFYNQNRKSIWIFLLIIFFLILILQVLNYLVGENQTNKNIKMQNIIKNTESNIDSNGNVVVQSNQSVVSGESISINSLQTAKEKIEQFLNACNKQEYEQAYNLLTDECKEEMYPNLEIFANTYASKIFNGQEISCNMENWTGNTYKVEIIGDILATGKVNEEEIIQDYITINNEKLNVNSYIGRTKIGNNNEKDNINIEVLQKDTYMDYEKYTIKIDNDSESDILLDTKQDMKSMYIEDRKEVHYSAYTQELTDTDLTVYRNNTRTITIKYYSSYNTNKTIKRLVFSNVIMNYDSITKITANKQTQEIGVNI